MIPKETAPAPRPSSAPSKPVKNVRTEKQQARNRHKLQQWKKKKLAKERLASQQRRLAKQPGLPLELEIASKQSQPTPLVASMVDLQVTKSETPEKPVVDNS